METLALVVATFLYTIIALRLGYETGLSDGYQRALEEEELVHKHIRY